MQGIKLDLEHLEYKRWDEIYDINWKTNFMIRKKGYVLGGITFNSDGYHMFICNVCVLEEKYFQRIIRILEKNTELSKIICIEEHIP